MGTQAHAIALAYEPANFGIDNLLFRTDQKKLFVNSGTFESPVFTEIVAGLSEFKFDSHPQQWNPITGLSGEEIKMLTVDTSLVVNGAIEVIIDGSLDSTKLLGQAASHEYVLPTSSVSLKTIAADDADYVNIISDASFNTTPQNSAMAQMMFHESGLHCYTSFFFGASLFEYALTVPWDLTTMSYTGRSFSIGNLQIYAWAIKSDGTKIFATESSPSNMKEWSLSTAFEVDTMSFTDNFDIDETGTFRGLAFKTDGTKWFTETAGFKIKEFTCDAWDTSTSVSQGITDFTSDVDDAIRGFVFSTDGKILTIMDTLGVLYEFVLSTAWDISTHGSVNVGVTLPPTLSIHNIIQKSDDGKHWMTHGNDVDHKILHFSGDFAGKAFASIQ